ncbi:DUF262 domain-containing protein [Spiroplasma sp. SV19]|uniref:DUF262 domain-containing protein n=1 Tax=Spiroplasma sp. SV19 TaxID=2570468 RepID=UPI0024B6D344|nr:DUF262 domain-containing protein [Spiroplasma sp. SV19]
MKLNHPEKISLEALLQKYQQLKIPPYQRRYSWGVEQWKKFSDSIDEMWEFVKKDPNSNDDIHYTGTIILHVDNNKNTNIVNIVDGQQRITTYLLLLSAFLDYCKIRINNKETGSEEEIDSRIISDIRKCLFYFMGNQNYGLHDFSLNKIELNKYDQPYYEATLRNEDKFKQTKIYKAKLYFTNWLENKHLTSSEINDLASVILKKWMLF